jgi:hypothetical protein
MKIFLCVANNELQHEILSQNRFKGPLPLKGSDSYINGLPTVALIRAPELHTQLFEHSTMIKKQILKVARLSTMMFDMPTRCALSCVLWCCSANTPSSLC